MRIVPKFGEMTRMTAFGQILERDVPVEVPDEVGETLIRQGTAVLDGGSTAKPKRSAKDDEPAED